jgi:hypothetical protein
VADLLALANLVAGSCDTVRPAEARRVNEITSHVSRSPRCRPPARCIRAPRPCGTRFSRATSSLQQVHDHRESTARQYDLKRRAHALGWPPEQIVVIDDDQGLSGASAAERSGFQRLVAEVGLGRVGLVLGLEVSRLARNSSDWHRLLEICALAETLILDEDGIYDPSHFNDRLLLGLKGTLSEAELHVLRARLLGGLLNDRGPRVEAFGLGSSRATPIVKLRNR